MRQYQHLNDVEFKLAKLTKNLNLQLGSIKEMLTKEQMKRVLGGDGYKTTTPCHGRSCSSSCPCKAAADWCVNGQFTPRPNINSNASA